MLKSAVRADARDCGGRHRREKARSERNNAESAAGLWGDGANRPCLLMFL